MSLTVNADLGESFGVYAFGHDEALLEVVDLANVACGVHAGDPSTMRAAAEAAVAAGVGIGAHPGLPDREGFGRRRMALAPAVIRDHVRVQVGALDAVVRAAGGTLRHLKPHGALFAMLAEDEAAMDGVCDVAEQFGLRVLGMAGTAHEAVCTRRGVPFSSELYVDLDYRADGSLIVGERRPGCTPEAARNRIAAARRDGTIDSVDGTPVPMRFESVCVHSDGSDPVAVAQAAHEALR